MAFCTDVDLLYWEPNLFKDGAGAAQTLLAGVADVSGTSASVGSLSLGNAHVEPLDVIQFTGASVAGAFPIVSVDSDSSLTMSVLYDGLFHSDGSTGTAPHAGTATGQAFAVRTFYPQRQIVTQMLLQAAGLEAGEVGGEEKVVNLEALRRVCALGALQLIYSALAAAAVSPTNLSNRADLYERLYRSAMRSVKVELDLDGDGVGDCVRVLNLLQLVRG
ncbi:MAG TPA: hypothetical protein VFE58_17880 [Tepidisphaeraceae bacterium]|nr:hypothetical protein [Tepidisphaeraceae bacterium]